METKLKKIQSSGPKKEEGLPFKEIPTRNISAGAGSSGAPLRGPVATSEAAVELSAKVRDKPVVRNLTNVKLMTLPLGVSTTDTPLQGASSSSIPTAGEGLGHLVSGVGGFHLAKKALPGCARRKLKKARVRASKASTGAIQQPGNVGAHKQGETSTETPKRPRSEGTTPSEMARSPKRPRDSSGPGTYKEALTNKNIAIFRETYPENELMEDDQNCILEEVGRVLRGTPTGEQHLKSYRLEAGALIYIYAITNSLVNGSSELLIITGWNQGPG
jgi:hypothetical protein